MNRLRGKKKGKDETAMPRPSMESESAGPFRMFGKKKLHEDEPKKEVDLSSALPSSDNFRTSLLMTGLSARFSMLREQDDPNSKIGKASDDSVLFPKRQSRLMDFGLHAGLDDIAEIESLKAPPISRLDSFHSSDDAASTSGSIMNRAKPTDGNNLFGGRQKIYKIPAGASSKSGGMPGRALYDDDVAQSAFQKWRQAERERQSMAESESNDTVESDMQLDYNFRRETNSTMSSAPSVARNSTAATSVTSSQPSSSVKDWSSASVTASLASQPTGVERSVTRTRRLYEQGLTQDLQDQQSSAMSRMDSIAKQRPLGTRTPDLTPPVPSPTSTTFGDRFERRPILTKASAPNLRSFSPPTTIASQISPAESSGKFSRADEKQLPFTANPPLSPPLSEHEDHPSLSIQPNDRGKATAAGVFSRPAQQYDESKYAQRQRQLQQGREAPSAPGESGMPVGRSWSSSSQKRQPDGMVPPLPGTLERGAQKGSPNPAFSDESDDMSLGNRSSVPSITPHLSVERPDDDDHPAFRKSALPTPLSLSPPRLPADGAADSPRVGTGRGTKVEVPEDSPTLGPISGLSGMVRQHLRHDSAASSMYGATDPEPTSATSSVPEAKTAVQERGADGRDARATDGAAQRVGEVPKEQDDFARHLADRARRVREKLTSYVESDNERSAPAVPFPEAVKEPPVGRTNGLDALRSKSSRGSLFDRETRERSRSKSAKSRDRASSNAAVLPSPSKTPASTMEATRTGEQRDREERLAGQELTAAEKEESVPAGLRAFRQARRELQRMKETEAQQKQQHTPQAPVAPPERPPSQRGAVADNGPPPAMFNRMARDESWSGGRSRAGSRAASERDRSGSEASAGGAVYGGRGPRLRNDSAAHDEPSGHGGAGGLGRPNAGMRPVGLPGTDIKHSPIVPPHNNVPPKMASPATAGGMMDASGRRMGRRREVAESHFGAQMTPQHDGQPYSRSRNGSMLGATASTPNLRAAAAAAAAAAAGAPPLPPINPRRKNSPPFFGHGDEGDLAGQGRVPLGVGDDRLYGGTMSDGEGGADRSRQGGVVHGMVSAMNSRPRQSPPRRPGLARPTLPYANMSSSNLPGGMI